LPLLLEANSECDLVTQDDTVPISDFKFGMKPTADYCKISMECTYVENVVETVYNTTGEKSWFMAGAGDH